MRWRDRLASALVPATPSAVQVIEPQALEPAEKAATGIGVTALTYSIPLWSLANTPQRKAWQAARLYHENYLIRLAERPVSTQGGSVAWHLEDEADEEVTDESAPKLLAIRDLLEKPQAALPLNERQPGLTTRRGLWSLTLRHMGLCGTGFWYLDQAEALSGTPLAILYLAPWRVFEVTTKTGQLLGWTLDKPLEEGGQPLELTNVLPFYLDPPDRGNYAVGLVEAAGLKASLDPIIDNHIAKVIGSGGRLAGLISPKQGTVVSGDDWKQFVADYRNITADTNAALKLQIVQGAVDYVRTAATLDELSIVEIDERTRDAILGLWGVPRSQVGIAAPAGLNSGSTKGFDEAILWQGAIHPRLLSLYETIQYGLLDRYKALGTSLELVIDEPEFDDDTPLYQRATQAADLPLTNDERRNIVGFPPLDTAVYGEWGQVVIVPNNLTEVAGPGVAEKQAQEAQAQAEMQAAQVAKLQAQPAGRPSDATLTQPSEVAAKAGPLGALRERTDRTLVPKIKSAVSAVLEGQKASVLRHLRTVGLDHLRKKPNDVWRAAQADRVLREALEPFLTGIARSVSQKAERSLRAPAKADPFASRVAERVLTKGAGRVKGINATTRDAIAQAISDALEDADTINDVIAAVEGLDIFDEYRAELIARTESMFAYNAAAIGSFEELGVEQVQAIDGDDDEECAARDGQVFTLDEADAIEDHPNGTLDWVPVIPDEPAAKATRRTTVSKVDGQWVIEEVA